MNASITPADLTDARLATTYGLETMGVVATAMHVVFFAMQVVAAFARSPDVLGGPATARRV